MVRTCSSSIVGGRGSKSRRKLLRGKSHKRKMSRGKARRKLSRVNSNAGDIRGFLRGARKKLLTRKRRRALDSYKKSTNKRLTAMHAAERKRMAARDARPSYYPVATKFSKWRGRTDWRGLEEVE